MASDPAKVSTSALAKRLEIPVGTLFSTLSDAEWISKQADGWHLTSKGEYEGGEYRDSQRYGRYIVWPQSVAEHSLIQSMERSALLTAVELGRPVGLQGQTINRLLHELGWLHRSFHGWELTDTGRELGGEQMENQQTGMRYAQWPALLRDNPVYRRAVDDFLAQLQPPAKQAAGDLFDSVPNDFTGMDGHIHRRHGAACICDWLYLAGVVHACGRRLPTEPQLLADFYLPDSHVYIEYWGDDDSPEQLRARMARDDWYKQSGANTVVLRADDLPQLNDILSQQLLRLGVHFH